MLQSANLTSLMNIMGQSIQAIRGMSDLLPSDLGHWQYVEKQLQTVLSAYAYQEIRFPILEKTTLFSRSIGEGTDVVDKEMYSFADRHDESLSLRPEGTAGCVRACLQHGLLHNQSQKLWYNGPMFRYERPQKGRYRQFYQLGVEAFGFANPSIDVELIALSARFWKQLGISEHVKLEINTLATAEERIAYRQVLVDYFQQHFEQLDEDSQRRLTVNPLRILDSKNPAMAELIVGAPKLIDYLNENSQANFAYVTMQLDRLGIAYVINPRLMRGLDYYSHTVFEWVTDQLGAQSAICAGGRYDGLIEQLGGRPNHAVGFALGFERLMLLLETVNALPRQVEQADIYLVCLGAAATDCAIKLAEELHNTVADLRIVLNHGGGGAKAQFKRADKSGARIALLLGDDELAKQQVTIKWLREDKEQQQVDFTQLPEFLNTI